MLGGETAQPQAQAGQQAQAGEQSAGTSSTSAGEEGPEGMPTTRDIALLLARFGANNHSICDAELRPVGVGCYPLASMLNHSCDPNCVHVFKGNVIEMRWVAGGACQRYSSVYLLQRFAGLLVYCLLTWIVSKKVLNKHP